MVQGQAPGGGQGASASSGGRGGTGTRSRPEKQIMRTVYLPPGQPEAKLAGEPKLKPVQIKIGISDGSMTEVLDGLAEGAQVVTSMLTTSSAAAASQPANPFGGGPRRF